MNKAYAPPQDKIKYGEETRPIAACYSYIHNGKYVNRTWLCDDYPRIYARDIARPRDAVNDNAAE